MILVKGRKLCVPQGEKFIGFEGDNLVETRYFKITDKELFDMEFRADIGNTGETVYLEKDMSQDDCIVLSMPICAAIVKNTPHFKYQLRAIETNGDRVWHSEKSFFVCSTAYDAHKELDEEMLDEFHRLEKLAQEHRNDAEHFADSVIQMSETISETGLEVSENMEKTKTLHDEAQSARDEAVSAKNDAVNAKNIAEEMLNKCSIDYGELKDNVYTKSEIDAYLKSKADSADVSFELAALNFNMAGLPTFDTVYTKGEVDNLIGNMDAALDELHSYALSLIGGEA